MAKHNIFSSPREINGHRVQGEGLVGAEERQFWTRYHLEMGRCFLDKLIT